MMINILYYFSVIKDLTINYILQFLFLSFQLNITNKFLYYTR